MVLIARRVARPVVVGLALVAVISVTATADTKRTQDDLAHDAAEGSLDIKWVEHSHDGRKLVHTIRTYQTWRSLYLKGDRTIQINISRGASPGADVERVMVIAMEDRRLRTKMFNVVNDTVVGYGNVSRPDRRTVKVTFPRWFIQREGLEAYRYQTQIFDDGTDHLPSSGPGLLHRL